MTALPSLQEKEGAKEWSYWCYCLHSIFLQKCQLMTPIPSTSPAFSFLSWRTVVNSIYCRSYFQNQTICHIPQIFQASTERETSLVPAISFPLPLFSTTPLNVPASQRQYADYLRPLSLKASGFVFFLISFFNYLFFSFNSMSPSSQYRQRAWARLYMGGFSLPPFSVQSV